MSLAIVQNVADVHNSVDTTTVEIRFASNVTVGNLLIAIVSVYTGNGPYNTPAGWTLYAHLSSGATTMDIGVLYRYAQAGDAKNFQIDNNGRNFWGLSAWEISGVTGVAATDIVAAHFSPDMGTYPIKTGTSTSFNTTNNNELVLNTCNANSISQNSCTVIGGTGYVADALVDGSDTAFCSAYGGHYVVASSGTAIAQTMTTGFNSGIYGGSVELQSGATTYAVTVAETVSLADTVGAGGSIYNVTLSESVSLVDSPSNIGVLNASILEAMALADTILTSEIFNLNIIESMSLADQVSMVRSTATWYLSFDEVTPSPTGEGPGSPGVLRAKFRLEPY